MLTKLAHRLKLASQVFLTGTLPRSEERTNIPAITAEEVAEARTFFPLDKFFIFGYARSGTTLLMRLVSLHPEVHCHRQAHFFSRPPLLKALVSNPDVAAWLARPSNRWNRGHDLSPVVLRAVSDLILEREARQVGKRIVGDKSPNNLLNGEAVRLLNDVYPDARLVFIIRDGRDATISHRFQTFIDGVQHLPKIDRELRELAMKDPQPYVSGQRSVFTEESIRQAAMSWVRNITQTHQMGQALLGDQYLHLRFEDLLDSPCEEVKRIWTFLGADVSLPDLDDIVTSEMQLNTDADWQQHKAGDFASYLPKGKPGYWREIFTARDRQVFKEIAGDTLITWGYERDMDW